MSRTGSVTKCFINKISGRVGEEVAVYVAVRDWNMIFIITARSASTIVQDVDFPDLQ